MGTDKQEKNKPDEMFEKLTNEDKFQIEQMLNRKRAIEKCEAEVQKVLDKYNAMIVVDPSSRLDNIMVKIMLKN